MVNVAGVGVGGRQQQRSTVFSLSDFILSPPAPPTAQLSVPPNSDSELNLDQISMQKDMESQSSEGGDSLGKGMAKAILTCRPNSHPFQERVLILDTPVKIGRSVARCRPGPQNSTFDCKVLSRNHAQLWYKDGKFYLQDTKSSNGTFVNNQRLSKGSEESAPQEVCSGDIVQFGVDVMENSRKVTHGCIIATLRLFMPDGQEAKASPSVGVMNGFGPESGVEVQQLKSCLQEAHFREANIQTKLDALSSVVQAAQEAAEKSWSAMIGEDRLLQKLEMMEAQLATYAKNWPEDKLREEVRRLHEEKCQYESHVKDSLARMLSQKSHATARLAEAERALVNSESELSQLRIVAENSQLQLTELLEQQATQTQQISQLYQQLQVTESKLKDSGEKGGDDSDNEQPPAEEEVKRLREELSQKSNHGERLLAQIESANAEADFSKQQLEALQTRYGLKNSKQQDDSSVKCNVLSSEHKIIATRLKQFELDLRNGQSQLVSIQRDVAAAERTEERLSYEKVKLEKDLNEARCRAEASSELLKHLQYTINALQAMLHQSNSIGCTDNRIVHHDSDMVSSNNDINASIINDLDGTLVDENESSAKDCNDMIISPAKIYEDLYEDFTLKRDPSKEDSLRINKDEKPEKVGKEGEEMIDGENLVTENVENEDNSKSEESDSVKNASDDSDDDLDSVCTEVTLTGPVDRTSKNTDLIASLSQHLSQLQELRETTRTDDLKASGEVSLLRGKMERASNAVDSARSEVKTLRTSLLSAESFSSSRAFVVSELQQSTVRLGAAGNIIRQQLEQLNSELVKNRETIVQEKGDKLALQERLQEAEALAKEGVEQTETLNKQLQQLKLKAMSSAVKPDTKEEKKSTVVSTDEGTVIITDEGAEGSEVVDGTKSEEVVRLEGRVEELEKEVEVLRTIRLADEESNKDSGFCEGSTSTTPTLPPSTPTHSAMGETSADELLAAKQTSADELLAAKQQCEGLQAKLLQRELEFENLALQNKMAFALSVIPLFLLLLAFVTAFHDCIASITGTHDYT